MSTSLSATFHFNVPAGQYADISGKLFQFKGRARDKGRSLVFEDLDGIQTNMSDEELLNFQYDGRGSLRLLTTMEASERLEESGKPRVTLAANDAVANAGARRRLDYCHAWDRAGRPPRTDDKLLPIVDGEFERRKGEPREGDQVESRAPSTRQASRWIADWLASGGDIEALVPQMAQRGNRSDRLHPKARAILTEVVDERYLVNTRPSAVAVYNHVIEAFAEYNEPFTKRDRLAVPSLRAVYRTIRAIDEYTRLCTRVGRRAADVKYRPTGSCPATTRHNEVWEIDHTTVDLIVVDENSGFPIGRPTVTAAIDRHTRMVVGLHIGFDPPGTFATMECLRNAILPKGDSVAGLQLANRWPCIGTPETLVPDQGKEFKSRSFIEANLTVGVDVQYTPVLKAWYKGKIERFFRTLATDVFHRMPGTTFSDIFDRNKERAPETIAVATLDELRVHTVRYIVDVYHQRRHRGMGVSPLEAWNRSVEIHGMRPLPDPDRVTTALSANDYRTPQPYGIEYEGLIYNSMDVGAFRIRPGKTPPVRIAIDPRDLTAIRFLDPADNVWHPVPIKAAMQPHVEGVSLQKHKLARALQRANPDRMPGMSGLVRAYAILDDAMQAKSGESGMANRRKAARYWEALKTAKRPHEPAAFDIEESGRSLVEDLYGEDGDEESFVPAPEPKQPKRPRVSKRLPPVFAKMRAVEVHDDAAENDDDIQPLTATTGDGT